MAAARKKIAALRMVNTQIKPTDKAPAGIARIFVRGLRASYSRSAIRLKAIAVERAPTMATMIQIICHGLGMPPAPRTAPRNAKGSANSVCSILIISSVVRRFVERDGISDIRSQIPDLKFKIPKTTTKKSSSELETQTLTLKTQNSKLKTQHSKLLLPLPTRARRMGNSELVENSEAEMIYQRLDRLGAMIKTGAGGDDLRARARELQHILDMNRVIWRLARNQDKFASFLQSHVGRAMYQVRARA